MHDGSDEHENRFQLIAFGHKGITAALVNESLLERLFSSFIKDLRSSIHYFTKNVMKMQVCSSLPYTHH